MENQKTKQNKKRTTYVTEIFNTANTTYFMKRVNSLGSEKEKKRKKKMSWHKREEDKTRVIGRCPTSKGD